MVPSKRTGGNPLLWAVFWLKALSLRALGASSLALRGFVSLLTLSPPGPGMFCGYPGEFGGAAAWAGSREQLATSSLPSLALRSGTAPGRLSLPPFHSP